MIEALLIASLGVGIGVLIVALILLRRSAGSAKPTEAGRRIRTLRGTEWELGRMDRD